MFEHDTGCALDIILFRCFSRRQAHLLSQLGMQAEIGQFSSEGGQVLGGEEAGLAILDEVARACGMDPHHRQSRAHRLDGGHPKRLRNRCSDEDITHRQIGRDILIGAHARAVDTIGNSHLNDQILDFLFELPFPATYNQ
jgi:hypothetical protein